MKIYEERLNRIKAAIALEPVDKVPVISGLAACAAPMTHTKVSAFLSDLELNCTCNIKATDMLGNVDGVQATLSSPEGLPTLWLSNIGVPGEDIEDDQLWQVIEKELVTQEDYDVILRDGFGPWYLNFMKEKLRDPLQRMKPLVEYGPTAKKRFEEAGFLVVQTRPTEAGLYGAATQGYKRRDMQRRAEIIRESAPAAVISVHQNFFSLSSRRGAQVFFREGNERSRTLACAIQTALNAMPECVRPADALRGDYYVLNCSDYASVIVECGFLSNAADEALLVTEAYRARLADTICAGTLAYLAAASSGEGAFG